MTGDDAQGSQRRIVLLVEDDAAVRRSLQLLLRARGHDVRAHASGATLLADPIWAVAACLVADYRLGSGNGFDVLSSLRARGWSGPAVLITAFPLPGLSERAMRLGFGAVIEKPLRAGAVEDAVAGLLGPMPA